MKSLLKLTFNGFHVVSNSERKNFDGSLLSFSKEDIELNSISVDTEIEYSVEEMLAAFANSSVFIKELPNIITASILAVKTAMATDVAAKVEETEVPEASEPSK